MESEMRRAATAGEDGIHVQTVIVTVRNAAGQTTREIEIERTFEDGAERQTTVRAAGYETLTSEAHDLMAVTPDEARVWVEDAEERGLLTRVKTPAPDLLAGMRGPDGELGTDIEPEQFLDAAIAAAEGE